MGTYAHSVSRSHRVQLSRCGGMRSPTSLSLLPSLFRSLALYCACESYQGPYITVCSSLKIVTYGNAKNSNKIYALGQSEYRLKRNLYCACALFENIRSDACHIHSTLLTLLTIDL